ncbi:manganese catalase family protein [Clostridiales bacterium NSJ-40]|uniref:Manganese catalase family protein n=1 Tax=Yeguia hominis TaxID=2763662 RepID=A0A926D8P5_9FIRM|nr:manganese catalase family protein [Yeguia hominis]
MSESSYFLILSSVEKLCIFKPKTSRLSSYLIHWNISDASLGTEELAHLEMVSAIVYQLTRNLTEEEIQKSGFAPYFVDHTTGIYPTDANGVPFSASTFSVAGDAITDIHEDMAAEQKARTTYDNILRFCDDPDVRDPIKFLRQREVVHYQRFGEGLRIITDHLDSKNFYAFNPEFDRQNRRKS